MNNTSKFFEELYNTFNNITTTTNGAITNITSGSHLVDQFGRVGTFRGRKIEDVFSDMEKIWAEDKDLALKFIFYLRLITRTVKLNSKKTTEKVQKGQGSRDEAFKRLLWVAVNDPDVFYRNIWVLPFVGSWKDIWTLMLLAKENDIKLDNNILFILLATALKSQSQVDLVLKFLPRIKTTSNIHTEKSLALSNLAKEFANFLKLTPRQYNKLKSSGKAHDFQKIICGKEFDKLNWDSIPGIALNNLVTSKFLYNQKLVDNYISWLEKQDAVKFNGYPYQLLKQLVNCSKRKTDVFNLINGRLKGQVPEHIYRTIDLQFDNLIATAKKDGKITENVLCALDTSGSMGSSYNSPVAPIDICISLGIYFSTLNEGAFHKKVIMFNDNSSIAQLQGTFSDMLSQIPVNAMGSTNFMSVVEELARFRKENPTIPLEQYPTTLLVVSDMQFNPTQRKFLGYSYETHKYEYQDVSTTYEDAKNVLYKAFPKEFVDNMKFVWWNVNGEHENMPATLDNKGCFFFSGFDGAILSLLLNEEPNEIKEKPQKTMDEVLTDALNQEVLQFVTVAK